jgi:hypothetical protein
LRCFESLVSVSGGCSALTLILPDLPASSTGARAE